LVYGLSQPLQAATYDAVVEAAAKQLAGFIAEQGNAKATVMPQFRGLPSMPGGGGAGFTEMLKEHLAPHGIQISSRADYSIEARLELNDQRTSALMVATVYNRNGKKVHEMGLLPQITDPKDLAETLGIPTYFGPEGDNNARQISFKNEFDDEQFYSASADGVTPHTLLFSDAGGKYGMGIRVGEKMRPFENRDGLPYTKLDFGEQYTLFLINNTDQEVAANVKIDGVNVFHFADTDARRPDGSRLKYWIVKPNSTLEVKGWHKNNSKQLRFAITPVEEGAAAKAGITLEDVGLVTATFHSSWQGDNKPSDEPQVTRTSTFKITRRVPVTLMREVPYTVKLPNGETVTRTKTESYTAYREVHEARQKVSTGFGEEVLANTNGVNRTIGISRATLAFRYDRKQ